MPSRIFDVSSTETMSNDAIVFLDLIARNKFKCCISYPFMPKKVSRSLVLELINAIYPDKFASIEDMLRTAPIGIVQFFLVFSNDINLKVNDRLSIGELVLQRHDLDREEFSLLISILQRQNYCGFSTRTSSGLSIMENILVEHSSIPQFEEKIESMIAAGIKVTPKTLTVACNYLGNGCYTAIRTLCCVLNTVPYRSAIKAAADRAIREGNDVFSHSVAAEIISALLSSITTFRRLSVEIPINIIAIINQTGFPEYCVLWGVDINGKRANEVFSEGVCNECISSIKSLFDFFIAKKIDSTIFVDIITSYMERLSDDYTKTFASEIYKFYLRHQEYFGPLTSEVLINTIEKHVDLSSISPSREDVGFRHLPASTAPDTIVVSRRRSAEDAARVVLHEAPTSRYDARRASEPKEIGSNRLPPRHPVGNSVAGRRALATHCKFRPIKRKPALPIIGPHVKLAPHAKAHHDKLSKSSDEHERFIDIRADGDREPLKFPPIAPAMTTRSRARNKYRA